MNQPPLNEIPSQLPVIFSVWAYFHGYTFQALLLYRQDAIQIAFPAIIVEFEISSADRTV